MPSPQDVMKHWCSPVRWVAFFSNLLLQWVGQRTVMGFQIIEATVAALSLWWYYEYRMVAHLGVMFVNYKSYMLMAGLRVAIASFGFYAVFIRKIHLTKVYFGLFILGGFLALLAVLPIQLTECACTSWKQCKALASFASVGEGTLLNPYWPPNSKNYEGRRRVPYEEAPDDPADAKHFTEAMWKEWQAQSSSIQLESVEQRGRQGRGDAPDSVLIEVNAGAFGHRRLVNKHRKSGSFALDPPARPTKTQATVQQAVEEPDGGLPKALHEGYSAFMGRHQEQDEFPGNRKGKKKSKGGDGMGMIDEKPLHFFNVTDSRIGWVGTSDPECNIKTINSAKKRKILDRLGKARNDPEATLDDRLTSELFLCAVNPTCGAVSAEVIEDAKNGSDGQQPSPRSSLSYQICLHWVQLVPVPVLEDAAASGSHKVYFQRNPVTIRRDLEASNENPSKFYKQAFRSLKVPEAMKLIQQVYHDTCRCEQGESLNPADGGCRTYKSSYGIDKFWCWVDESSLAACTESGVKLFWDEKKQKVWSEELCTQADCKCSHLGMPPRNLSSQKLNSTILTQNKLNYGSDCKRWSKDNPAEWCYVGWDSTCQDRFFAERWWASSDGSISSAVRMQYSSPLPCNKEKQSAVKQVAQEACQDITRLVELILVLIVLLHFPMTVIIFKFLSNRCGDEFNPEEQFAVVFSTDEEESEDDWEATAATKEKGKQDRAGDVQQEKRDSLQ